MMQHRGWKCFTEAVPPFLSNVAYCYCACQLSEKKYTTQYIKQTLNPDWDFHFDISVSPSRAPKHIAVTLWDKDKFGRDFMGELMIPFRNVFDRNQGDSFGGLPMNYNDPANQPSWFSLNKRSEKDNVKGQVLMKFGFVEDVIRSPSEYV
jgi:Ca2+-dependent lipid-binding protein